MRSPRLRPLPVLGAATTVAVAATVALTVQPTDDPVTSAASRATALSVEDDARRTSVTFAGARRSDGYPDITPGPGDRGVPDDEPIGFPQVVAAAAEPPREAPEPTGVVDGSVWDRLAQCESGGDWASTVGQYEGGLQFHPGTWDAYKPSGYPEAAYQASREQQILVAERVLAEQGWGAWPACSAKLGLR